MLALPSGFGGFVVSTDTSARWLRCVLMKHGNIITYSLSKLKNHEGWYAIHDLE